MSLGRFLRGVYEVFCKARLRSLIVELLKYFVIVGFLLKEKFNLRYDVECWS